MMNRNQFLDNAGTFAKIIHSASKESTWPLENYKIAFRWAECIEEDVEKVTEDEEASVNAQLAKINVPVSELRLSCTLLSCSKHLLLRSLLNNPFIEKSLLSRVLTDFLRLGEDVTEDVKIARENAKKTLDLDKRVSKVKKVHLLYHILHSLSISLLDVLPTSKEQKKELFSYTFLPKFLTMKTFAKLLKKRSLYLYNRSAQEFDTFKTKLFNHACNNIENMEILCLVPVVSINTEDKSKPEMNSAAKVSQIERSFITLLLGNSELPTTGELTQIQVPLLWKVHPWILTELSFSSAYFFSKYISFIVTRIGNLLSLYQGKEFAFSNVVVINTPQQISNFDEDAKDIQRRLFYIIHRSSEMSIICTQVLRQFIDSPLFQLYSKLVPRTHMFFKDILTMDT